MAAPGAILVRGQGLRSVPSFRSPGEPATWPQVNLAAWVTTHHSGCATFAHDSIPKEKVECFRQLMEVNHYDSRYHNFAHAVDVLHAVGRVLKVAHIDLILSELDRFSLQIAAVAHGVGHRGLNNIFLIGTGHELATLHNDRSLLEHMHCSKLDSIIAERKNGGECSRTSPRAVPRDLQRVRRVGPPHRHGGPFRAEEEAELALPDELRDLRRGRPRKATGL